MEALLALGWARDDEEEALFVPKGRYFSMAEARIRALELTFTESYKSYLELPFGALLATVSRDIW